MVCFSVETGRLTLGEKCAPGVEEKYEVSCAILAPGVGCKIVESGRIFLNVRYLVQIKHYFFCSVFTTYFLLIKRIAIQGDMQEFFHAPSPPKNGFHVGGGEGGLSPFGDLKPPGNNRFY